MAYSQEMRDLIKRKHDDGLSYKEIAEFFKIPKASVQSILKPSYAKNGGVGRPKSIMKREKTLIKREINKLKKGDERVTSTKIVNNCQLTISRTTIQKALKEMGGKFRKIAQQPPLKKKNRVERVELCRGWFEAHTDFKKIIISDECRFSLDGPDNFQTWQFNAESEKLRNKH